MVLFANTASAVALCPDGMIANPFGTGGPSIDTCGTVSAGAGSLTLASGGMNPSADIYALEAWLGPIPDVPYGLLHVDGDGDGEILPPGGGTMFLEAQFGSAAQFMGLAPGDTVSFDLDLMFDATGFAFAIFNGGFTLLGADVVEAEGIPGIPLPGAFSFDITSGSTFAIGVVNAVVCESADPSSIVAGGLYPPCGGPMMGVGLDPSATVSNLTVSSTVPEPGTWLLLGSALLGLALRKRPR